MPRKRKSQPIIIADEAILWSLYESGQVMEKTFAQMIGRTPAEAHELYEAWHAKHGSAAKVLYERGHYGTTVWKAGE